MSASWAMQKQEKSSRSTADRGGPHTKKRLPLTQEQLTYAKLTHGLGQSFSSEVVAAPAHENKEAFRATAFPANETRRSTQPLPREGNGGVRSYQRLGVIQRKLRIGGPEDVYEQEADRIAELVTKRERVQIPSARITRESEFAQTDFERSEATPGPALRRPLEAAIDTSSGHLMNPATREALETAMGVNLGNVLIHNDSRANEAVMSLNARAFTQGRDIFLGRGESESNLGLMAHETTHVLQQKGGLAVWNVVQAARKDDKKEATDKPPFVDEKNKTVVIPVLPLPEFKKRFKTKIEEKMKANNKPGAHGGAYALRKNPERSTNQASVWRREILKDNTLEKVVESKVGKSSPTNPEPYYLRSNKTGMLVFGSLSSLVEQAALPFWDKGDKPHYFDVDHQVEEQLGGENKAEENMWLLDSSANRSSGSTIKNKINEGIIDTVTQKEEDSQEMEYVGRGKAWSSLPSADDVKAKFWILYEKLRYTETVAGEPDVFWEFDDVKKGKPLQGFSSQDVGKIRGEGTNLLILPSSVGGKGREIPWNPSFAGKEKTMSLKDWLPGFTLEGVTFDPDGKSGSDSLTGTLFKTSSPVEQRSVRYAIEKLPGVKYGGYIGKRILPKDRKGLFRLRGLSPIDIAEERFGDQGFYAVGQVLPGVPLIRGASIDLVIEGDSVRFRKLFSGDEFNFPSPIQAGKSTLEISAGTEGLGVEGLVDFGIAQVGRGSIGAKAKTGLGKKEGGFEVEGNFDFDTKLFDKADIRVKYSALGAEGKFSGEGDLEISKRGKVPGIRSAKIAARLDEGQINASGAVEPDIPGVKSGTFALRYFKEGGLEIGGTLELSNGIPGIRGGSIQANVKKKEGGEGYSVSARGTAKPSIPGVDASINAAYDDGVFTIEGTAAYEKGMLNGSVLIGATNRLVGPGGVPQGAPTNALTAYGGGEATIRIAPWLQGTIGLKLLPNGEVQVSGSIGLPASVEIFPEKKFEKNILTIGIDVPIVGVAVLGQRIGIFANISGGLDLSAGVGPGELRQLGLSITYNPAHEEQTHVHGGGHLHVPAAAGLRLFVSGSLGAGIPIVSASAGLQIGGKLGLEGAVEADVQIDWTPLKGLMLDAVGEIHAEPKLKFDITGFVKVEANVLLKTVELYDKRWNLASYEWGSGLSFGLTLPIHYQEGKPFEVSWSDVRFQIPEVKPKELLSDLVKRIA